MSNFKGRTSRGIDWEYNDIRGFSFIKNPKKSILIKYVDKAEAYAAVIKEKEEQIQQNLPKAISYAVANFFSYIELTNKKLFDDRDKVLDPEYIKSVLAGEITAQQNDASDKTVCNKDIDLFSIRYFLRKELITFGSEDEIIKIMHDHETEIFDAARKYLDFWMEK